MSPDPRDRRSYVSKHAEIISSDCKQGTFLFFILWFLIRLANQSLAVALGVNTAGFSDFATASAIKGLSSTNARRFSEYDGRVKKTNDHRSYLTCSPGGGLRRSDIRVVERNMEYWSVGDLHHTMEIRPQYSPTEDGQRIANVTNGMPRQRLYTMSAACANCVRTIRPHPNILPRLVTWRKYLKSAESVVKEGLNVRNVSIDRSGPSNS